MYRGSIIKLQLFLALAGSYGGPLFWLKWNLFGDVGFCGGRKTGEPGEKNLGARREPTTNSTHIWHLDRIEPGPHCWEASTLTTVPSPLPIPCSIS